MKADARRYVAFRFFGAFQWPPAKRNYDSTADESTNTVRVPGVVDIFYVDAGNRTNSLSAYLRWLARDSFKGDTSWQPIAGNLSNVRAIQTYTDNELLQLFADPQQTVLLKLAPPRQRNLIWGRRLLFRGGLIFDQYEIDIRGTDDASRPKLPPVDRRLLLSRKFAKGSSRYYSDLIIGQPDANDQNPSLRFDLGLPTITPQFKTGGTQTDAFPFGALYPVEIAAPAAQRPVSVSTLVVGLKPWWSVVSHPSGSALGEFGFSKGTSSGCVDTPARAWSLDGDLIANRVLKPIGFATSGSLSVPATDGAHRFSVRFESASGPRTRIFHRLSVAAGRGRAWESEDLAKIDGRLHFKVPDVLPQWLDAGSDELPIELEHSYHVSDDEVWRVVAGGSPSKHQIVARLGLTGAFPADWQVPDTNRRDAADLLRNAIRGMRLAILALQTNQATAPDSLLADVEIPQQSALFALTAEFGVRRTKNGNLGWAASNSGPDYRLTMWHGTLQTNGDPAYELSARAWLPLVTGRKGGVGHPDLYFGIADDVKRTGSRECQFRLVPATVANPQAVRGVLAGLAVQSVGSSVSDSQMSDDQSHLWFSSREPRSTRVPGGTRFNLFQLPDVSLRLRLGLSQAAPVALSLPWGDRSDRDRPLLITSPKNGTESRFLLDGRETISDDDDRWLQADLIDQTASSVDSDEYVVLSQEPFGLVRFRSQALEARGAQDNAIVASYDSDTRKWLLKRTTPSYHYEFPPQVAGESMDKPKRLELHDLAPPAKTTVRPAAERPALDDLERRAVEFRLSPSAEIWVRPTDVERGYVPPPWETKELFNQTSALGVGVGLDALRAEFMYGLSVGIKPGDELGPSRRARIAEIESLVGRLPNLETTAQLDNRSTKRWAALQKTLSRRPERLEIWSNDPESDVAFAPARFQRGARFALRSTALHRPPIIDGESLNEPESGGLRFDEGHGLSGGALWPLESKNFFNALVANPASTGGSIERLALSAIGGDADQKADFLENRLAIISETRNGFVQRHKIEIIGRIGVFWHRAKHVVVYDRTVNPSAQFTPEGGIGTRTRRPVLRKVSEYIELIEPVRNYPDFSAELESTGFLRSVRFNQKIINVDSEWSEDAGTFGWKIPLWNRHSAAKRPLVYPRPDIGFFTNAEGEGDSPTSTQECLDPDNLFFFADATPGAGDNTDDWSSRAGIDYSLLPFPSDALQRQSDSITEEDGRAPSARRIPRGYRRFTWRLGPASARTVANAGRSDKPLYVGLESITFMRPRPKNEQKVAAISEALISSRALTRPESSAQLDHWQKAGEGPRELDGLDQALVGFLEAVRSEGDIKGAAQTLVAGLQDASTLIDNDPKLQACVAQARKYWDESVGKFGNIERSDVSRCDKIAQDFVGSIRRKQLLVLEEIRSWEAYDLSKFVAVDTSLDELVAAIAEPIKQILLPILTETVRDVAGAGNSVAVARQIARDLENEIARILQRAIRELNSIKATYDYGKPWSTQRLAEFHQRIRNVQQGVAGDLEAAAFEIQHRFVVELDQVAQQIASDASFAVSRIIDGQSWLSGKLDAVENGAKAYLQSVKRQIERAEIHKLAADAKAKLDAAVQLDDGTYRPTFLRIRGFIDQFDQTVYDIEHLGDDPNNKPGEGAAEFARVMDDAVTRATSLINSALRWLDLSVGALQTVTNPALQAICEEIKNALALAFATPTAIAVYARDFLAIADGLVETTLSEIDATLNDLQQDVRGIFDDIDRAGAWVDEKLKSITEATGAAKAVDLILEHVVKPSIRLALHGISDLIVLDDAFQRDLRRRLRDLSRLAEEEFKALDTRVLDGVSNIKEACSAVGGALEAAEGLLSDAETVVKRQIEVLRKKVEDALNDVERLREIASTIDTDVRKIGNDLADSFSDAQSYVERVSEAIGEFNDGNVGALPGKVLRLYAAVATAPEMPNLEFARERLGYYYKELDKIIDTTKVEAWFGKLGDELKALGLSIPFSQIGDALVPLDLENYDIGRIFRNFGGLKLDMLFRGYRLPPEVKDAIRVTHDFDKKQFRAWVQIDVNAPIKGRKSLFSIGPFQLDFVNTDFIAKVRLDASKDSDEVEQTGSATLVTDIEAVVGGQTMVTLRRVTIRYDKKSGLKVDFDPKGIKLNPSFQFIQDSLGSLFPNELGGMKVIKQNGVPVGVEHVFAMPPVSLMYATSGVSNISISNSFSLVAFPDFVISDKFSLSKPELPFLFSLFILGGTGYITVDTTYRPFRNELIVVVEAAAGGSASLGFAFGPISGQVLITLSAALGYRKLIGKSGGGLTVSLVLLVAGNVSVAGIATVYIGLLLRLNYRDTGQIDAAGTLTVSIKISRFFTLSARANAKYTLRGGKSQTVSSIDTSATIDDDKLKSATAKAKKLMGARYE